MPENALGALSFSVRILCCLFHIPSGTQLSAQCVPLFLRALARLFHPRRHP